MVGLWSKEEAIFVRSVSKTPGTVLWGCDMDEAQPHLLIRELAAANPMNPSLERMVEITRSGYSRSMAPELLKLAHNTTTVKDVSINGTSLLKNVVTTLEIESDRLNPNLRLRAQVRRESLMKELFLMRYEKNAHAKVLVRFGRNHLHRGYDSRGVSTLGNFIAEFAFAQQAESFHLAAFGAGGRIFLGSMLDWDERKEDPAFDLLASLARYPATVFDLRPLRQTLHRIPTKSRSAVQASLVYWADSYDAIICY